MKQARNFKCKIGKSEYHAVKILKFLKNFTAQQQKERRVPIQLQTKVKIALEKLFKAGYNEKLSICSDKSFIYTTSSIVKKDHSVKLDLHSILLYKSIHKKHQHHKPNFDSLNPTITKKFRSNSLQATAYFSSINLQYA